eukprot:Rhum_TRINITY_DN17407_c0_g1::Rhum_TRINITY_DN17407_c0_g1_i1::g.165925::m.165925
MPSPTTTAAAATTASSSSAASASSASASASDAAAALRVSVRDVWENEMTVVVRALDHGRLLLAGHRLVVRGVSEPFHYDRLHAFGEASIVVRDLPPGALVDLRVCGLFRTAHPPAAAAAAAAAGEGEGGGGGEAA